MAQKIKIQYMVAFIKCQLADQNTTTNQILAAVTEGSMEGICNKQDVWGERDAIMLGALQVGYGVKIKIHR